MVRRLGSAVLLAMVLGLTPARADMVQDCIQSADPDRRVGGCTAAIRSGQWAGAELAWAYYNRGNGYRDLAQHEQALADYDQAARLDPGNADIVNGLGRAYEQLGRHQQAIDTYGQALRLDPASATAYYNRGNVYVDLGQDERAIEDYSQAIRLDPAFAFAYGNRGNAHARLGRHQQAIDDYDAAIRLQPQAANTYLSRAVAGCRLGHAGAAAADWNRFMDLGTVADSREIQELLAKQGYYDGPLDGLPGPITRQAVQAYAEAECG